MIGRLKSILKGSAVATAAERFDEHILAAAALLIEVATVDNKFSDAEREKIIGLIRKKLLDDPTISEELMKCAQEERTGSVELFAITKTVTRGFSYKERVDLMDSLWEVVLADGKVDPFEDQLIRRLGALIHVTDRDRALSRRRVLHSKP